jgi:SPW repeat
MQFRPLRDAVFVKHVGAPCLTEGSARRAHGVALLARRDCQTSTNSVACSYRMLCRNLAAMFERSSTRENVIDLIKLVCAAILFLSPWVLDLSRIPAWNLWVCGYAMLTASLAAIVAEADWEPRANLWLGTWVMAAPWILGFPQQSEATLVHVIGGTLISMLSAIEVWFIGRSPPWRFGPGAAQRTALPAAAMTVSVDRTAAQRVRPVGRRRMPWRTARSMAARTGARYLSRRERNVIASRPQLWLAAGSQISISA